MASDISQTPSQRSAVSELLWYSRILIWIGAGTMLLDRFLVGLSGRSLGMATAVAAVFLIAGFIGFVIALAADGRRWPAFLENEAEDVALSVAAPPGEASLTTAAPEPTAAPVPAAEPAVTSVSVEPEPPAPAPVMSSRQSARRVPTQEVPEGVAPAGLFCPFCEQRLRPGQLAATCWECSTVHHAACWTENRFHCARDGCSGHGSLEEPQQAPDPSPA